MTSVSTFSLNLLNASSYFWWLAKIENENLMQIFDSCLRFGINQWRGRICIDWPITVKENNNILHFASLMLISENPLRATGGRSGRGKLGKMVPHFLRFIVYLLGE